MNKPFHSLAMLLIALLAGGFVIGCSEDSETFDQDIAQDDGELVDPTAEHRLVTFSPALTQIIADLGLGQRIVGVADFDSVAPEGVPSVGNYLDINYERLVTLNPSHVFFMSGQQGVPSQLTELSQSQGFDLFSYSTPANVNDIINIINKFTDPEAPESGTPDIGTALGKTTDALRLTNRVLIALAGISRAVEEEDRPNVLICIGVSPTVMASGPDTVLHDVLTRFCNAENAAVEATVQAPVYDREQLLNLNPDVILLVLPNDPPLASLDTEPRVAAFRGLDITAVKEGRIVLINDPLATLPSSGLANVAALLAKAIHPGKAADIDVAMEGRSPEATPPVEPTDAPEASDADDVDESDAPQPSDEPAAQRERESDAFAS